MTPSLAEVKAILNQINDECEESGQNVVPFDDLEYYTNQIAIIWELDTQTAMELAEQLTAH